MKIISSCCKISYFMLLTWGATRPLAIIMNTNLTLLWTSLLLYINNFKVFGKSCKKLSNKFDAGERSFVTQLFTKWISLPGNVREWDTPRFYFFSILIWFIKKRIWQVCRCNLYDQRKMWKQVFVFFQIYLFKFRNIFEVEVDNEVDRGCMTNKRCDKQVSNPLQVNLYFPIGFILFFFVTYLIMEL